MKAENHRPFRHVRQIAGELTTANFDRFNEVVFEEIDSVLGLDLMVAPSEDGAGQRGKLVSSFANGQLIVYKVNDAGGAEVVVNGGVSSQWAMWRANGFYLVKSGGMNQGICSVGLVPTDEAALRLNPAVKVIRVELGAD